MSSPILALTQSLHIIALLAAPGAAAVQASAGRRPNILVFVADDASAHLGVYGDRAAKTPHLDALGRSGMVVRKAFVTSPQCSPSRSSMLSGRYPHSLGTEDLHVPVPAETKLLPRVLNDAGYFTGLMLKGHVGRQAEDQFNWNDRGFAPDYVEGRWNNKAQANFTRFLDAAETKPFFLWVGFVDPHRPYGDPANAAPQVTNPGKVAVPPWLVDNAPTRHDLAAYQDELARLDGHVGGMLAELDRRGLRESTLIVFVSDNGLPFPRGKGTLYDAGIRTPLLFSWKGQIEPGATYDGLVSLIDLAPTLLDVAGLEPDRTWPGQSLAAIFKDQQLPGREHIFAERNWHETDEHMRAVRSRRYKLIVNSYLEWPHGAPSDVSTSPASREVRALVARGRATAAQRDVFRSPRPAVELYDVVRDPHEIVNLAGSPGLEKVTSDLVNTLDQWMKATGDHPPTQRRRPDEIDRLTGAPLPKTMTPRP